MYDLIIALLTIGAVLVPCVVAAKPPTRETGAPARYMPAWVSLSAFDCVRMTSARAETWLLLNRSESSDTTIRRALTSMRNLWQRVDKVVPARLQVVNVTRGNVLAASAEIADTAALRNRGLLGRTGLEPGEGMWIVPGEAVHTFGMQFVIDLAYIDRNHTIRKVRSCVPPWRISACLSAHSVLELPSGTILQTKTQVGDEVSMLPAMPKSLSSSS